jgi:beta-glucosidase
LAGVPGRRGGRRGCPAALARFEPLARQARGPGAERNDARGETSLDQLPHPVLPGAGVPAGRPFNVDYAAGAAVGYKWFQKRGLTPLFPFGYGLSYTRFRYTALRTHISDAQLTVSLTVTNIGNESGAAVPQVYVGPAAGGWEAPRRLGGWSKVTLPPGGSATPSIRIDPRLLAVFDAAHDRWQRPAGIYEVWAGDPAASVELAAKVPLPAWSHPARWAPPARTAR